MTNRKSGWAREIGGGGERGAEGDGRGALGLYMSGLRSRELNNILLNVYWPLAFVGTGEICRF